MLCHFTCVFTCFLQKPPKTKISQNLQKQNHQKLPNSLSRHISDKHTNQQFSCRYQRCGVKCPTNEQLLLHYKTHPEKQHKCAECPMSFDHKPNLTRHALSHSGARSHTCEFCEKGFAQKGTLKYHMLTHTGEKNSSVKFAREGFR